MEELPRPSAPSAIDERLRAWIGWFGVGRIAGSAIAVVVVCAGAFWLVRSPPPPTEASLPRAGAPTTTIAGQVAGQVGGSIAGAGVDDANTSTAIASSIEQPAAAGSTVQAASVVVHVAGAVAVPGVYDLGVSARAGDAVAAAGGVVAGADPDALNLAAPLADGSRIYVPMVGEQVPPALLPSEGAAGGTGDDMPPVAAVSLVDVNRATADELDALPGVGPATASAIVTERERNGPFLTVEDLERVPGIGPAKLAALRDLVTT